MSRARCSRNDPGDFVPPDPLSPPASAELRRGLAEVREADAGGSLAGAPRPAPASAKASARLAEAPPARRRPLRRRLLEAPSLLVPFVAVAAIVFGAAAQSQTPTYPGIGRTPTDEQIRQWDIAVGPSGKELPPGRGTARTGAPIYMARCIVCHGPSLEGTLYGLRLVGGQGTLTTPAPIRTVGSYWAYATTLWDYINRAMPWIPVVTENSLSADDVYALTAFVLFKNGIIDEDAVIDAKTLPQVRMPNRDGFVPSRPDWRWYQQFCHLGNCRPPDGGPAESSTPTRIIALNGDMTFGNVTVGSSASATLTIGNSGNSTLTVNRIVGSNGIVGVLATPNWDSGTVAPGESLSVVIRFSPTAVQAYKGTLTVYGDQTGGTNAIAMSGVGRFPPGGLKRFGAGRHRVGVDIAAGRYYSVPAKGCYWERESGLGGSSREVLANHFIGFKAGQWIVDILPSDKAFKTVSQCGTWFSAPGPGAQGIPPGMWLVGHQISPGTYRTTALSGCYWERLRDFRGVLGSIIARNLVSSGGPQVVSIVAGDVGFDTNDTCGTWTLVNPATAMGSTGTPAL